MKRLKLTSLAKWAKDKEAEGKSAYLPSGLSDVFNVISKNGARSNTGIISRLDSFGINTFIRSDRCLNFDNLCLFILANIDLKTRSFSLNGGVQSQMAKKLGVTQPTVSRLIELLTKMRLIRPAFCGDQSPTEANRVLDKNGVPLNEIYFVEDDFGYLAGKTAGDKLAVAFSKADEKASKSGFCLHDRLIVVRNTLWEGTIERRIKGISEGCLKKTISKITDRSRATAIIQKRAKSRGDLIGMTEDTINKYINIVLKACGFTSKPIPDAI